VVCRGTNDNNLNLRYQKYFKILTDVLRKAKIYYNEIISKLKDKTKTTWRIIKKE